MQRSVATYGARAKLALALLAAVAAGTVRADSALDLDQYRGSVVVVDFWASWCVPCRRSFPWLNAMQARYGEQGLVIVGVNVDSDPAEADAFLADYPAAFRIVKDPGGALAREFDVIAMPSTYVVGRDGTIVKRHLGFKVRKQDEYEAALRDALAAAGDRP